MDERTDILNMPEPIAEPVPEPVPEPVSEPVPEPVSESVPEPVSEPVPEPAAESAEEVVLCYVAPGPEEISLLYVPPKPEEEEDDSQSLLDELYELSQRQRRRKGLKIFLFCLAVLIVATAVLGLLYWRGNLVRGKDETPWGDYRYEYDWRGNYNVPENAETTIARYPNGGDTRLRYAETHGSKLSIQDIYARVNPCTVTIATALPGGGAIIGTGVIFTPDGYILTNAHVVSGGTKCFVVLDSGRSYDNAKLVGFDSEKDLAVIKIEAKMLPTAEFGDSDTLTVGDTVYAIGNPLGVELRGTLTDGIVSAINRDVNVDGVNMTLIQTNAALNNGNSGGPLINVYGQVVGINTMKMGSSSAVSVEGLGFAIPISSAAWMVNDLIAYGEIHGEPVLGISVLSTPITLDTGESALEVQVIEKNSASEKAGLHLKDRIVRADGDAIGSVSDLLRARRRYGVGETLTLEIDRNGERLTVDVILEESRDS